MKGAHFTSRGIRVYDGIGIDWSKVVSIYEPMGDKEPYVLTQGPNELQMTKQQIQAMAQFLENPHFG